MAKRKGGHRCIGTMLVNDDEKTATCYECGRTIPFDPRPIGTNTARTVIGGGAHRRTEYV